jgi:DNA primase
VKDQSIEAIKGMNLVEFLSQHYGLVFQRRGATYQCCSPFTEETQPSFFVRQVDGHWLFKDFSSGAGGSIFDFVQMKEKLASFSQAKAFVGKLLGLSVTCMDQRESTVAAPVQGLSTGDPGYDVGDIYDKCRNREVHVCRDYLVSRGIASGLVEELIDQGIVVHNRYEDRSYCCFAVRDDSGLLKCLDNHAIEGTGKFVLGAKTPFSCEWEAVKRAKVVFVSEGIIDYLSIKSLELAPPPGVALLGNQLCFPAAMLENAETIVSAMDDDRGGDSAVLDLKDRYPEKEVRIYDLEGSKDPNELLQGIREGKGRRLNPERKLQLYREFQTVGNKKELAERWGIDRSHLYQIVRECEQIIVGAFSERKRGRPSKEIPATLEQALARIKELEAEYEQKATAYEEQHCRSEFLAIRLKWAEIEASELRGEPADEEKGSAKKRQVKKKKNRRRSRRSRS